MKIGCGDVGAHAGARQDLQPAGGEEAVQAADEVGGALRSR